LHLQIFEGLLLAFITFGSFLDQLELDILLAKFLVVTRSSQQRSNLTE